MIDLCLDQLFVNKLNHGLDCFFQYHMSFFQLNLVCVNIFSFLFMKMVTKIVTGERRTIYKVNI
jgi:hypothetical protein